MVSNAPNVDEAATIFQDHITLCIRRYVPTIPVLRPRGKKKPRWLSQAILCAIKKRNSLWRKAKIDPTVMPKYKCQYKRVRKMIASSKRSYINDLFSELDGPAQLWDAIRRLEGKSKQVSGHKQGDNVITDSKGKSKLLANQFDSVWQHTDPTSEPGRNGVFTNYEMLLDVQTTIGYLKSLDTSKAAGPDCIPPILFKRCSRAIAPSVSILINRSIRESKVPELWKKAIITPVPKKR